MAIKSGAPFERLCRSAHDALGHQMNIELLKHPYPTLHGGIHMNYCPRFACLCIVVLLGFALTPVGFSQALHSKIVARTDAAEKVTPASCWAEFKVAKPYDEAFDFVRTWLQKQEFKIESANM